MTNNGASGSGDKSSAEKNVPSPQEGEGDEVVNNAPVRSQASLARGNPRQEQQQPRLQQYLVHVDLQPRGPRPPMPRPPPPTPAPQAPQHAGGASGSGGMGTAPRSVSIVVGGGIQVGGGAEDALGGVGSPPEAPRPGSHKRKADVVAPVGVRPICSVCRRDFYSWKALFGHMRSHPDRTWRGCFPPPVEGHGLPPLPPAQPPVVINAKPAQGQLPGPAPHGLNIDLNEPQLGVADADADADAIVNVNDNVDANAEANVAAEAMAEANADADANAGAEGEAPPAKIDINMPAPADDDDIA